MAERVTVSGMRWAKRKQLAAGKFGGGPASRRQVGERNRRILGSVVRDGIEVSYHATKGYRRIRVAPSAAEG